MIKSTPYLLAELFLLFIVLPTSFALDYSIWFKAALAVSGLAYIVFVLKRVEHISFRPKKAMDWKGFWKRVMVTGIVVVIVTMTYVLLEDPPALFFVLRDNPLLFISILFVYTMLSVWPQEVIYRTFFFRRYESLFRSKSLFIFVNAVLFSLAHLFFKNTLVIILTFLGGILFALSYRKFRSTTMVSIEHAIYGNWLFTVGMGHMLGFPGMESPN